MSREEKEQEKAFLESLDRMLGGEPVKDDPALDDDLKSALRMASDVQKLGLTPSEEFKGELKAKLLQQIYEKERQAKERQGWFWRWVPRQFAWQAVSAVALILVVVGIMWGVGVFNPSHQAAVTKNEGQTAPVASAPGKVTTIPTTTTTTRATTTDFGSAIPIAASATTDKTAYASGQDVIIRVGLKNTGSQPITIEHFPPILSLMQADTKQPVYTFAAGSATWTIAAGDTTYFSLDWNQQNSKGGAAAPGSYYVELEDVNAGGQTLKLTLSTPTVFTIQSGAVPTTAGEAVRTVSVNSSQTVNGITVTLEKVEILAAGERVYAFATPPADYALVPGSSPARATQDYAASAYYSLDGGWFKDAGVSTVAYYGSYMSHVWVLTEPVSSDASEILFTVSSIGSWKGTWQFRIPLK